MRLTFLGATQTVTGSKYLLQERGLQVLVDCGLFQGYKQLRLRNWESFPVTPADIDAVVLSHAHIDHSGYLPLLTKQGFSGPIYCSEATAALCGILLPDAGRIQEDDAARANKHGYSKHTPAMPLYTEADAYRALELFRPLGFGVDHHLPEEVDVHFSRAGHILGSALLTFRTSDTTLVFSGDLGRPNHPVMTDPATIQQADYLVLDSTYGNRRHPDVDTLEALKKVILQTSARGGHVIIPAFAVGRSQTILYYLYMLKERKEIPDLPIFLDSPMAQNATDVMQHYANEHRLSPEMCEKVCGIAEYTRTPEQSKAIYSVHMPSVIVSASGMAEGGRVLHHLKHYGPDPKNTILFAGFQVGGSRGDRILRGESAVKIHGEMVPMRAKVEHLEAMSSHADYEESLAWLEKFRSPPRTVFLTHGESEACEAFKAAIEKRLGWNVKIPEYAEKVEL